jgi:TPP-dependent indolepyruvate ferredoxin oxidoreductase alpha subunit
VVSVISICSGGIGCHLSKKVSGGKARNYALALGATISIVCGQIFES